jgi:hypothetical protein
MIGQTDLLQFSPAPHFKTFQVTAWTIKKNWTVGFDTRKRRHLSICWNVTFGNQALANNTFNSQGNERTDMGVIQP